MWKSLVSYLCGRLAFPEIFERQAVEQTNSLRLLALLTTNQTRNVVLYGEPGKTYGVEYKTNLDASAPWTYLPEIAQPNYYQDFGSTGPNSTVIFYRAYKKTLPFIANTTRGNRTRYRLLLASLRLPQTYIFRVIRATATKLGLPVPLKRPTLGTEWPTMLPSTNHALYRTGSNRLTLCAGW